MSMKDAVSMKVYFNMKLKLENKNIEKWFIL